MELVFKLYNILHSHSFTQYIYYFFLIINAICIVSNNKLLVTNTGPLNGHLSCLSYHENYAKLCSIWKVSNESVLLALVIVSFFLHLLSPVCAVCMQNTTSKYYTMEWCNRLQSQTPAVRSRFLCFRCVVVNLTVCSKLFLLFLQEAQHRLLIDRLSVFNISHHFTQLS